MGLLYGIHVQLSNYVSVLSILERRSKGWSKNTIPVSDETVCEDFSDVRLMYTVNYAFQRPSRASLLTRLWMKRGTRVLTSLCQECQPETADNIGTDSCVMIHRLCSVVVELFRLLYKSADRRVDSLGVCELNARARQVSRSESRVAVSWGESKYKTLGS